MNEWQHWRLTWGEGGNVELFLEVADRSVNVLHRGVLDEMEDVLDHLASIAPPGVILGTEAGRAFALGADVSEFAQLKDREQALAMLQRGQQLFLRLENLDCPTVAAIRGDCLGGGLELAMACDYRVVESGPNTRIGLPEVQLGIHPGYGGTLRLPKLVGDRKALRLMLTGKPVAGPEALKMQLADATVPPRQLYTAARLMIKRRPRPFHTARRYRIPHLPPLRAAIAWGYARGLKSVVAKDHYPAPYQLLKHWQGMSANAQAALKSEAQSVANLFDAPRARQLTRIFLLRQELRAQASKDGKLSDVHVVGAGVMGGDIAVWCALQGLRVTVQDTELSRLAAMRYRAQLLLARRRHDFQATLDRLIPDPDGRGAESADVVIEAIPENLDLKRDLYRNLEGRMRPDALLATNTSSLPLDQLAQELHDPMRLIGIHFFNPVHRMPLVEIIHYHADQQALRARAAQFARRIKRVPLAVQSSPGFLVNRILMPYLLEAMRLLEEGHSAGTIDQAATGFGMPMGPLKLADMVGLDVCLAAGSVLAESRGLEIPKALNEANEAENYGRKSGRGFYQWKDGKAKRQRGRKPPPDCTDRLLLNMVRESVHCLHEKLVERADWIDAGLVLGAGFPPFTGGPLELVRANGADAIRRRLETLQQKYGERFAPGPGWDSEDLRREAA